MQTIDLDSYRKLDIHEILPRLAKCEHAKEIWYRLSPSWNGYHIKIWCTKEDCEMCRLCFDDPIRFAADFTNRKPYQRNVLFTFKAYKKNGKTITLKAGEWNEFIIQH